MIELVWMEAMGGRHLMVTKINTSALRGEPVCGWSGEADGPGLPCNACHAELWSAVATSLSIAEPAPQPDGTGTNPS